MDIIVSYKLYKFSFWADNIKWTDLKSNPSVKIIPFKVQQTLWSKSNDFAGNIHSPNFLTIVYHRSFDLNCYPNKWTRQIVPERKI